MVNVGGNKLKIIDLNNRQLYNTPNNFQFYDYERYGRLYSTMPGGALFSSATAFNYQLAKIELYRAYEDMDRDSILAVVLDVIADSATQKNEYGNILRIQSPNENVQEVLGNLFYDVLNIDFNLWTWVRNMTKYGDMYLKLNILENHGIVNVHPLSPYSVVRIEDIYNPGQEIKFIYDPAFGIDNTVFGHKMKTFDEYEIGHFRLIADSNFLPYGRSVLEPARKSWEQLIMMEDAMLINRVMRAPSKRLFKIDIGNIPPNEVDNFMQQMIAKMKKVPYMDEATGNMNLKFNLTNMLEDFYIPVRGGNSGTDISTLDGLEFTGIEDIDYLKNRMLAALRVPKAFIGFDESVEGKCIALDTKIPLLDGRTLPLQEIIDVFDNSIEDPNLWVYSFDFKTNSVIPGKIKLAQKTRLNTQVVRVFIDNDTYIDCTPDHHFILKGGEQVEAQLLKAGDSLQTINRKIEKLNKKSRLYEHVYQPSLNKWQPTHKMVDEFFNDKIIRNGYTNDRFILDDLVVVHHVDFNGFNNHPNNLIRMRLENHLKYHSDLLLTNEKWIYNKENRRILNKTEEYRDQASKRQKRRIKLNPDLGYNLVKSWMNRTHDERVEICRKQFTNHPENIEKRIQLNKDMHLGEKMMQAYKIKFADGRPDLQGENNVHWIERPTIEQIVEFINSLSDKENYNKSTLLAKKMNYSHHVFKDAIKSAGWDISEFFNEFIGFRPSRVKNIRLEYAIEIANSSKDETEFLNRTTWDKDALKSFIKKNNLNYELFKQENIGKLYNHKVVRIEFLDEKIDTGNMEIDDVNHNFLVHNGLIISNSTLAAEDLRFAAAVERMQKIVESELYKLAVIHLWCQGFKDEDLVDFKIKLTPASTIYEKEKLEVWKTKFDLIRDVKETQLVPRSWAYEKILNVDEDEWMSMQDELIDDAKMGYRLTKITEEGTDPKDLAEKSKEDTQKGEGENNWDLGGGDEESSDEKSTDLPTEGKRKTKEEEEKERGPFDGAFDDIHGAKDGRNKYELDGSVTHRYNGGSPLAIESRLENVDKLLNEYKNYEHILKDSLKNNSIKQKPKKIKIGLKNLLIN